MSYTALYRKFRPTAFEDVKGQDHIVTTLQNQVKTGRIGHAYLFTGTRGTGKTTVAKIFARAVNCEHAEDGSPCNMCSTCKNILAGSSMNVIEIDAASNNGVDNIRQIRDEVQYSPTEGRYKVYIIDEVHMLSIGAFNALLKTLEEPPEYVIFILATTEVHKIPITILSRCQRYDFRRITVDTIEKRLTELIGIEGADVEPRAVQYIAKAADGSMRDALSLLDQCLAFFMGQKLTYENVLDVLGAVDTEIFARLLRCITASDTAGCIGVIEEVVMQGRELLQFVTDFSWYLRNLLLVKNAGDDVSAVEEFIDASKERLLEMQKISIDLNEEELLRYIRILSELSNQMKYSTVKRVLLEIALIKMTHPAMEPNLESVLQRISSLEKKIENGVVAIDATKYNKKVKDVPDTAESKQEEQKKPAKPVPEDVQNVADHWYQIMQKLDAPLRSVLKDAPLSVEGNNTLLAVLEDQTLAAFIDKPEKLAEVDAVIEEVTGKEIHLAIRVLEKDKGLEHHLDIIEKRIHADIKEEQEDF